MTHFPVVLVEGDGKTRHHTAVLCQIRPYVIVCGDGAEKRYFVHVEEEQGSIEYHEISATVAYHKSLPLADFR